MLQTEELFKDVIGQEQAKKMLSFYAKSHNETGFFPHTLLTGAKGFGKTLICRELQKGLFVRGQNGKIVTNEDGSPKLKKLIEVNCSSIKSLNGFINGVLIPHVVDKDTILFLDEVSEIPHDLAMAFLTLLPTNNTKASYTYDDYVIELDYLRTTVLCATSEAHKVLDTLKDRMEKVGLIEYTPSEIALIIQKGCEGISFEDGVLEAMASTSRGNARSASKLSSNIKIFLKHRVHFTTRDWKSLSDILGILPLGLTGVELSVLRYVAAHPNGISLTGIASRSTLSTECVRMDIEPYLLKKDLIKVEKANGRVLTGRGQIYLKEIDNKTTMA